MQRLRATESVVTLIVLIGWVVNGSESLGAPPQTAVGAASEIFRSARSGPWSAGDTWEGNKVPGAGARVLIRAGHRIVYDVKSDASIRGINVAGTLTFAPDRDTRLDVGLIKIQAGDEYSEEGFDCDAHLQAPEPGREQPRLEVGTPETARSGRAHGHDPARLFRRHGQAIVPGDRLLRRPHGLPRRSAEPHLGQARRDAQRRRHRDSRWPSRSPAGGPATASSSPPRRAMNPNREPGGQASGIARCSPRSASSRRSTARGSSLDRPLEAEHTRQRRLPRRGRQPEPQRHRRVGRPDGVRGHTMYHRDSAGSISYAEFRHLGKEGVLGRYTLHFHLVGDTMRGSSVIGASIWDSDNRWLTIHGTNYLVVRDCVGYQSVGHGFFLEDGTEVYNVLDRNLAVQALRGKRLPKQVLPFDQNEGAGFWWANSLNTFTRNVACENDHYGFRFEATHRPAPSSSTLPVQQPDGSSESRSISARCRSSASRTTRPTATGCTASTSARASTASARTRGIRSSSAT